MSKIRITKAGQALHWFKGYSDYGTDKRGLNEKIMDFADEHSLVVKDIEFNFTARPIYAYVLFEKWSMNQCGQCDQEANPGDLCSSCRNAAVAG